jgi:F-type H+-transporting ATPase subunit a
MTPEHELWLTVLMNKLIGKPVAAMLSLMGFHPDPVHPIPDYMAAEILVVLIIITGVLLLRRRLSVENPGKFQQLMEVFYEFNQNLVDDVIGHDGRRYAVLVGTLGIFVGVCNLIGIIPTMNTPSATIYVTLGCAVVAFLYYNYHGFRQRGFLGYLKHFGGPVAAIAFIMFPLEIFSSTLRMLSLSVRLWANMLVGNLIEEVFAGLVPVIVPALFMALHVFVSFLQAYVFMILPAVYISLAVAEDH